MGRSVSTLIGAYARGAKIDSYALLGYVEAANSDEAWKYYASVDSEHVPILLNRHRDKVKRLYKPMLYSKPELMIPIILDMAIGDDRRLNSTPSHPLRVLDSWVDSSAEYSMNQLRSNRVLLLDKSIEWYEAGGQSKVAFGAIQAAMSTSVEYMTNTPGDPRSGAVHFGFIPIETVAEIKTRWPRVVAAISHRGIDSWTHISSIVQSWVYPHTGGGAKATSEQFAAFKDLASTMVKDLVLVFSGHAGAIKALERFGRSIGINITDKLDPEYMAVFPKHDIRDGRSQEERNEEWEMNADAFVIKCIEKGPQKTATIIGGLLDENEYVGNEWPNLLAYICKRIADQVEYPSIWLAELLEVKVESQHISPFLNRLCDENPIFWSGVMPRCLNDKRTCSTAIAAILNNPISDESLFNAAVSVANENNINIELLISWTKLSEDRVLCILRHESKPLSAAAVMGLWDRGENRVIINSLQEEWRKAAVRSIDEDYWLKEMFEYDHVLAHLWISEKIDRDSSDPYYGEDVFFAACSVLSLEERKSIIQSAKDGYGLYSAVNAIVGVSGEMYKYLLDNKELDRYHLLPLDRCVDTTWRTFAIEALAYGYTTKDIVHATHCTGLVSGKASTHYKVLAQEWDSLKEDPDERIRLAGEMGKRMDLYRVEREEKTEELEERCSLDD